MSEKHSPPETNRGDCGSGLNGAAAFPSSLTCCARSDVQIFRKSWIGIPVDTTMHATSSVRR
jgi:hypothetical protein